MNILMISNIDDDDKLEDIWIARAFQKDGHNIFLLRNTWDTNETIENIKQRSNFRKRIIDKNLPCINFDDKYDGKSKEYLVKLYKSGYSVIPTIDCIENLQFLNIYEKFVLKLKNSYN